MPGAMQTTDGKKLTVFAMLCVIRFKNILYKEIDRQRVKITLCKEIEKLICFVSVS